MVDVGIGVAGRAKVGGMFVVDIDTAEMRRGKEVGRRRVAVAELVVPRIRCWVVNNLWRKSLLHEEGSIRAVRQTMLLHRQSPQMVG